METNYLKKELYELIKSDERIFDFIQESCLDGMWYWDLENPEEVVLGYFIVGAETVRRIYIDQNDLTFRQNKAIIPDDCREVPGAQVAPPADWNP